jgi:hypothetical protein
MGWCCWCWCIICMPPPIPWPIIPIPIPDRLDGGSFLNASPTFICSSSTVHDHS